MTYMCQGIEPAMTLVRIASQQKELFGVSSVFTHVASSHANLLNKRKCLHKKRVQLPRDSFGTPMLGIR